MKFLSKLFARKTNRQPIRARLSVEALESRYLLSVNPVVNSLVDDPTGPAPGQVTLRDAINQCNSNGGGSITFQSGLTGEYSLVNLLPQITTPITITGNLVQGQPGIQVNGQNTIPIGFNIGSGITKVEIDNLAISNFNDPTTGGTNGDGAAIYSLSNLGLSHDSIVGNTAGRDGAGLFIGGNTSLTVNTVLFQNNNAGNAGGGVCLAGTFADFYNCNFDTNKATGGFGGNVDVESGTNTFHDGCTIKNGAAKYGAGVYVDQGDVTFDGTIFSNNIASYSGGGLENYKGTVTCQKDSAGNRTFFTGNQAQYGGGVYIDATDVNTTFNGTTMTGNTASVSGGGYYLAAGGKITPTDLINNDGHN